LELEEKVVKTVKKNPDLTIKELAKKVGVSRGIFSAKVHEYEKRGLVKIQKIGKSKVVREASK